MKIVIRSVELHQFRLEVRAEDAAQIIENCLGEDAASVFGDEDHMDMHQEYAKSSDLAMGIIERDNELLARAHGAKLTAKGVYPEKRDK